MSDYQVSYANCDSYSPSSLRPALESVFAPQLAAFGGVTGKAIVLKPNFLAWRKPGDIACVHPQVVVETARLFLDAGAKRVAILENPAVQTAQSIAKSMGILEELSRLGVTVRNFQRYAPIPVTEGVRFQHLELAQEHLEFDAMVDLAKAKTHAMMTLTLCVKNLFGLIKGAERMGWHLSVGKDFPMFADMLLDLYLVTRPQFNLLDAVTCMEGNGPGSGDPTERCFLAGCSDSLALDASVAPILGVEHLLLIQRAKERGILPSYENCGQVPAVNALQLPDPPGALCEWGMPLPPVLRTWMREFVVSKPILDPKLCVGCGLCANMCPPQSLRMENGRPKFDLKNCIRCYCCQEHCPKGAIHSRKTFAMKVSECVEDGIRFFFR